MLHAEHRNPHMGVRHLGEFRPQPVYFVSEQNTNGEIWAPVEQIDTADACLDRRDFVSAAPIVLDDGLSFPRVIPGDHLFRTQRRLGYFVLRRTTRNSAKQKFFDPRSVSRPKKRADVVETANVVEQNRYW